MYPTRSFALNLWRKNSVIVSDKKIFWNEKWRILGRIQMFIM